MGWRRVDGRGSIRNYHICIFTSANDLVVVRLSTRLLPRCSPTMLDVSKILSTIGTTVHRYPDPPSRSEIEALRSPWSHRLLYHEWNIFVIIGERAKVMSQMPRYALTLSGQFILTQCAALRCTASRCPSLRLNLLKPYVSSMFTRRRSHCPISYSI